MVGPVIPCNIALIPPSQISRQAIAISRDLKASGGVFVLDEKKDVPHLTLYMCDMKEEHLSEAEKSLRDVLEKFSPTPMTPTGYKEDGVWINVAYERSKRILELQEMIRATVHPYEIRPFYDNTGFRAYAPHITFTKLAGKEDVLDRLPPHDFSFTAEKIGLFVRGRHATCGKLLSEFSIGASSE